MHCFPKQFVPVVNVNNEKCINTERNNSLKLFVFLRGGKCCTTRQTT